MQNPCFKIFISNVRNVGRESPSAVDCPNAVGTMSTLHLLVPVDGIYFVFDIFSIKTDGRAFRGILFVGCHVVWICSLHVDCITSLSAS